MSDDFINGAVVGLFNGLLSSNPATGIVWSMFKEAHSSLVEVKKERIKEFICFIEEHIEDFKAELFEEEHFQSIFGEYFNAFIAERHEWKRDCLKNILLNAITFDNLELFDSEIFISLLGRMNKRHMSQMIGLYNLKVSKEDSFQYSGVLIDASKESDSIVDCVINSEDHEAYKYLESLGLCKIQSFTKHTGDFRSIDTDIGEIDLDKKEVKAKIELTRLGNELINYAIA